MKRMWIMAVVAAALLITANAHAKEGFGVYMGLGGSFAVEKFDMDQLNGYYVNKYWVSPEYDDTAGINGVLGFRIPIPEKARVASMFCFELGINYVPNFEWEGRPGRPRMLKTSLFSDVDLTTYTASIRFDPKIGDIEMWRPYVIAGGGLMDACVSTEVNRKGVTIRGSNTEQDPCMKAGAGFDLYMTEGISLNMETTFVMGWHDLEEIQYINTSLGIAFHM